MSKTHAPKYIIAKWDGGRIVITAGSGLPATAEDLEFIKEAVASKIKNGNIESYRLWETKYPIEKGYIPQGNDRHPIDPAIVRLEQIRKTRGHTRASIAKAIFEKPSKLVNLAGGRAPAYMDVVRLWAGVEGYDIMLTPMELRTKINELISKYEKEHNLDYDDNSYVMEVKDEENSQGTD